MEYVEKLSLYLGVRYWQDGTSHKKAHAWYILPDNFVNDGSPVTIVPNEEKFFLKNPIRGTVAPGTIYMLSYTNEMKSVADSKGKYEGFLKNKDQRLELSAKSSADEALYEEKKFEQTEQGISAIKLYLKPMREAYRSLEHKQKIAFIAFVIREITS